MTAFVERSPYFVLKVKSLPFVFIILSLSIVASIFFGVRFWSSETQPLPGALPDGHTFSLAKPKKHEITIAVVEVRNGTNIADQSWVERLASPSQSLSVTVTRPALLVAFWWGDGDASLVHTATPNNGFEIIESLTIQGGLIQCIVATKSVTAGTYDVSWTSDSGEGAQLWLVAIDEPGSDGTPVLGGHTLEYHKEGTGGKSITTGAIRTDANHGSGSVILISSGHYVLSTAATPTDSKGNTYKQIGTGHTYNDWPNSGTQMHAAFLPK